MESDVLKKFRAFSEEALIQLEECKEAGVQVCGIYCIFAPVELIQAAGIIPVGLCGKQEFPIQAAEEELPATLCPLIKSSYGYAVTRACPFLDASDFILGETTCDGKKKMFELMADIKPLHLMQLPYSSSLPASMDYWYSEVLRLKAFLEEQTGKSIAQEEISRQIKLNNRIRESFQEIMQFNQSDREPVSGLELLGVMESKGFVIDPEKYLLQLDDLVRDLDACHGHNRELSQKPRILLTGTPLGMGSEKVLRLIEELGGVVVCMENCSGIKGIYNLVDETDPDPYWAIAKRYLDTPCSCMSPNKGRFDLISRLIEEFRIDGVVDLSWQSCLTYHIESTNLKRLVERQCGIPYIHISTDYSQSDTGQLEVRLEAFLELMR